MATPKNPTFMHVENGGVYMQRCLDLAASARGMTSPNPMVGCVLVSEGEIIGEGFHHAAGNPHAEMEALASVSDKSRIPGSTLYVNLEPCSHTGKTPPCAPAIAEAGVAGVVAGMKDPNPLVAGKGLGLLKEKGMAVESGLLEEECRELNRRFVTFHEKHRPYIILKWAQSADGFLDVLPGQRTEGRPFWISAPRTRLITHRWRKEEDAIMVGSKTAIMDNPRLTVREVPGRNPVRLVPDRKGMLKETLHLFDGEAPTWIFTEAKQGIHNKHTEWIALGHGFHLKHMLACCHERNIQSVIVEGGPTLLQSFLEADLWDEARIIIAKKRLLQGLEAPVIRAAETLEETMGEDHLQVIRNRDSKGI